MSSTFLKRDVVSGNRSRVRYRDWSSGNCSFASKLRKVMCNNEFDSDTETLCLKNDSEAS